VKGSPLLRTSAGRSSRSPSSLSSELRNQGRHPAAAPFGGVPPFCLAPDPKTATRRRLLMCEARVRAATPSQKQETQNTGRQVPMPCWTEPILAAESTTYISKHTVLPCGFNLSTLSKILDRAARQLGGLTSRRMAAGADSGRGHVIDTAQ
jgi:hypothetical protein